MRRGEIYYIEIPTSIGTEIRKARPGIIVSHDKLNDHSGLVEVVYMTTTPKEEQPTHVSINSCDRPSTALCEQVNTVSKSRIGDYCGTCTPEEMAAIDRALLVSLGIELEPKQVQMVHEDDLQRLLAAHDKAIIERDTYKEMMSAFLDKVVV
jgi:mRNA interferase MazF